MYKKLTIFAAAAVLAAGTAAGILAYGGGGASSVSLDPEWVLAFGDASSAVSQEGQAVRETALEWAIPESKFALPDRVLTEEERAAWVADYKEGGGAHPFELELLRLVNQARVRHGFEPLLVDDGLMMAARFYSQTLGNLGLPLGHFEGPYGGSGAAAGLFGAAGTWRVGHGGVYTPQAVFDGWMELPDHRAILLHAHTRYVGVGSHAGGSGAGTRSNFHHMFFTQESTALPTNIVIIPPLSSTIHVGDTITLRHTVSPPGTRHRNPVWFSSHPSVASVGWGGMVTAVSPGTAYIYARTVNGLQAAIAITVAEREPTEVSVVPAPRTLAVGDTMRFAAELRPFNVLDTRVSWTSENPAVATVDDDGNVTARAEGTARVLATAANGVHGWVWVTVR